MIAAINEPTIPMPSMIHTVNDLVQKGISKIIELIMNALQIKGEYQKLFGCALLITKHATVKNVMSRKVTVNRNSEERFLDPVSSKSKNKNIHEAKAAIKDKAQAGISANRALIDLFAIFVSLIFYSMWLDVHLYPQ